MIKAAKDQFGFKSVLIAAPNDQGGTDASKQLAKMYGENGIAAQEEYYQRGTTNFAPLAARVMRANPDAIEIATVPPGDAANLVKQLFEAGYGGVIGSLGGNGLKPIADGAGGVENLKNAFWLETSPIDHPGVVKMKADYKRLLGSEPPPNPLFSVFEVAAEVALQGISKAGTDKDPERIAEALRSLTPESRYLGTAGWRGKSIYGINQELTFPPGLGMVIGGKKNPVQVVAIPTE
jgi:branched-chain amino acid transport system substrate-binding protein